MRNSAKYVVLKHLRIVVANIFATYQW